MNDINKNDNLSILKPNREKLKIQGRLMYHDASRAWNTLRIKKPILDEFSHLKRKDGDFAYLMIYHRTFKDLKDEIEKLEKQESDVIPLLFFLCKKKTN